MKMRKLIALLSAALMLCSIIPMGAMTVSAAASDITSNFDNGSRNGWSGPTCSADAAYSGAYGVTATSTSAWGNLLKKSAVLDAHTAYKMTFWYKSNADAVTNAAFEMGYKDAAGTSLKVPLINKGSTSVSLTATTTAWTKMELYFATGDYTSVDFKFYRGSGTAGDAASICVDEIVLEEITATTDGYIVDGGFESGTLNFTPNSIGSISSDAHTGNYAVTGASATKYDIYAQKYVRTEKDTDYTFKFWAKASGDGKVVRLYVNAKKFSSTSSNDLRGTYSQHTANTGWAEYTVTFNSGSNTEIALTLCSSGSSSTFYLDDLTLIGPSSITPDEPGDEPATPENPYEPVEGNLLNNPSFETGDFTGWSTYSGTTITEANVHSGKYAIQSVNTTTEWGTMTKQTVSVTANTDYILTYWYYYDGSDASASFYAMANNSSGTIKSTHVKNMTPNTWTQVTVEFNSASNTSIIVYAKNGTANSTGTYYFDDFVLVKVGSTEPENPGTTTDPVIPAGNLVSNSTFENNSKSGWIIYNGTAVSTAKPKTGSYSLLCKGSGWNGIAHITFNTEVGKSYQVSFWYYIDTAGFNWKISGENTGTSYANNWQNTNLGSWQQIVVEFIADDTKTRINFSGLDGSSSPVFYIDDVFAVEVLGPSNDGFIVNGDFEIGKLTGWSVHQSTKVSAEAANGSMYGVNLIGNGGWGGMLNQSFKTTKGLKYVLTLDVKVNNYGVNMQVRNQADDANLASKWFALAQNGEWATYTFEFTAVSADTYLNFCGGGGGSSTGGEDVYVDNIKIVEIPCEHVYDSVQDDECNICGHIRPVDIVDIIEGGQTSISEDVSGLAFKFEIAATGATTDNNNKYVSGSASVNPYGNSNAYTLVAMGAVITNKAENNSEKMLNLDTVNGKSVINIEANYLLDSEDGSVAFATRVINIPDAGKNTAIYARCYYVFEKDGELIVIYDDIVSKSYNG